MENDIQYRGYIIWHQLAPIPVRTMDWCFMHEDFDGAGDSDDVRAGYEPSLDAAKAAIDELEDEA